MAPTSRERLSNEKKVKLDKILLRVPQDEYQQTYLTELKSPNYKLRTAVKTYAFEDRNVDDDDCEILGRH